MRTTDQIIETTKQLIAIPSSADNPAALQAAIDLIEAQVAKNPELTIEHFNRGDKPSFLAYYGPTRPKKFDILLNAHVDVVPGTPKLFKPTIRNGKLYGRGALDMKGTAAVLTSVFCELADKVPYALGLQIVTDEEIGGHGGAQYQIEQGVRANFVIMGEYANNRHAIYNAARGICWAEIRIKGKSAHGGHLWHGTNAVVKAGDFAGAVLKHYPTPDKETWTTTASVANLYTPNDAYNKVPDSAILKIDFRFTQEDPVFQSRDNLEAFIKSLDPEAELINLATFEPAINVEELNPYVQGLSAAMLQVTGHKPQFLGRPAASDGRHFAAVGNDIIEFGLYGSGSHSDDECVELASFDEYRSILLAYLQNPLPAGPATPQIEPAVNLQSLQTSLLEQLIAMPTVTSDTAANEAALRFIEQFLAKRGLHITRYEQNGVSSLLATTTPENLTPTVLLNAHVDVVPANPEDFRLTLKNGNFRGRGVADMKFAIASYLAVVDALGDNLEAYDFGILITTDEEVGGVNGVGGVLNQINLRPSVVIVPDGGENWQIEAFAKGVQAIELKASGQRGHASRPWEGISAIGKLLGALQAIEKLIPSSKNRKNTTLSIGAIEGGGVSNQISTEASALLDIRFGSLDDYNQLYPKIQAICQTHDISCRLVASAAPCINDVNSPYTKKFQTLIGNVTGLKPVASYSYGATDGRYFSALGIPTIVVSPISGGRHTDAEWLSKSSFEQFGTILETYIKQVAIKPSAALTSIAKTTHVWYATYGTGLSREHFKHVILGGRTADGTEVYPGCRDKTLPPQNRFMALPHTLYFAGESKTWTGGMAIINPEYNAEAHTISRAHLITVEQFEDIIAQQNDLKTSTPLPFKEAIEKGRALVGKDTGYYNLLLYCGEKDGYPIFTLTAARPQTPHVPPSPQYARILYKGLSQDKKINMQTAVDYMLAQTGIAKHYAEKDLLELFQK